MNWVTLICEVGLVALTIGIGLGVLLWRDKARKRAGESPSSTTPMSRRDKGIIAILVGTAILLIGTLFSSGSDQGRGIVDKISKMEIVLIQGRLVQNPRPSGLKLAHYEGRVAVPLKWPLSLSVLIILFGTGVVLLSKNKEK